MVDAPWYICNRDIHRNFGIPEVVNDMKRFGSKHELILRKHINLEVT